MISDELEGCSSQVIVEILDCPNNSESFKLGSSIVAFSSRGVVASIGNGVVLAIHHLREYCSKSKGTGIHLEDEFFGEVWADQQVFFIHE